MIGILLLNNYILGKYISDMFNLDNSKNEHEVSLSFNRVTNEFIIQNCKILWKFFSRKRFL